MNKETKATLTILIAEIQDCKDIEAIKSLLDCWVKANNLHPEEVKTFVSLEKLKEYINES